MPAPREPIPFIIKLFHVHDLVAHYTVKHKVVKDCSAVRSTVTGSSDPLLFNGVPFGANGEGKSCPTLSVRFCRFQPSKKKSQARLVGPSQVFKVPPQLNVKLFQMYSEPFREKG